MRALLYICLLTWLFCSQANAQQADSVQTALADSTAIRQFLAKEGPAEAVFSFVSPPPFRFNSGVYTISNPGFPLLNSPDSLVRLPVERAHKQRRTIRIALIATAVPVSVLAYSATRILLSLGSVIVGHPSSAGLPDGGVIRAAGIATFAGLTVTGTFNLASIINLQKGVRRHNSLLGRKMPTLFNPRGI